MQPPVPPPEVGAELYSWLVELGLVKGKHGPSQNGKAHVLPGRLVANLVSGEAFVELLNSVFEKHAVKQKLTAHAGQPQQTWTQVAKGLHRLSVELDDVAVATLAGGDQAIVMELLQELHVVYQHWAAQEAKRHKRVRGRRVQPQQGQAHGYARVAGAGHVEAHEKHVQDGFEHNAGNRDLARHQHLEMRRGHPGHAGHPLEVPEMHEASLPGAVADGFQDVARHHVDEVTKHRPTREFEEDNRHEVPVREVKREAWDALSNLSADRDFSMATSAPELLGLSMIQQLRITASQAQELLSDNGRRLLRAFSDVERNSAHLSRWLGSLTHYGGAVAELLLLRPEHIPFTLTVLGHGLQAQSDAGESACVILAGVCAALSGTHLRKACAEWLINSSALADMAALMSQRPSSHAPAVSVMVSCYGDSLLQLTSQYLKQTARGEKDFLATVHHVLRTMLSQRDLAEACHEQGVPSHFLTRSLQRLSDERSTAGTLQAAALLATDLWLGGVSKTSPQEGLGDLLAALKKATQSRQGRCPQMVAFSCLAKLLSQLCDNQDVEGTPAVYRTYIYALVECESHSTREFGTRCLLGLLEKYEGVPVAILAELSVKKFQVSAEPLAVIDIELFLVIAKHPRCTDRHAEMQPSRELCVFIMICWSDPMSGWHRCLRELLAWLSCDSNKLGGLVLAVETHARLCCGERGCGPCCQPGALMGQKLL
ncbi:SmE [Symbiodinium pilosum]|uniref:SmE protein n=1 Tax=Symbiodinium pilosum TaxID=2952 RepID=A0A812X2N2_SYMPI|nr:SmE [Symbiodinium pilosum]